MFFHTISTNLKMVLSFFFSFCRTYEKSVSFHNKVVAQFGMGFLDLPFQCSYETLDSAKDLNRFEPFFKRDEPERGPNQGD